ncbi:hypothetical protein [Streptomyces virginiae]|uniref:hypothetical protein n=1 Tax=Streptomyces virginiae TaxID=1961 RepID=UPI0032439E42
MWAPDADSDDARIAAHEKARVTIGGHHLHPRDLDTYSALASECAGLAEEDYFSALRMPRVWTTSPATSTRPWRDGGEGQRRPVSGRAGQGSTVCRRGRE